MKKLAAILGLFPCVLTHAFAACKSEIKPAPDAPSMNKVLDVPMEELVNVSVVSSNKTPTCITQAPSTISSYNYKEIKRMGARTLADVLTLVAGVQMQTIPNGRQRIWMRGVQADFNNKVALYIDNVPIKDAFGGFAIDEGLPVESIEKVEIIRGPGSALYGSNAFSGVISIFTFQAGKKSSDGTDTDNHLKNTVKLGLGESNTHLAYATTEYTIADAVDVKLEGKWLDTNGRVPDYNNQGLFNTRPNANELAYLHTSISALDGELLFNGFYSQFDNNRVEKQNVVDIVTDKNFRFSLSYKHDFSTKLGININAYHTDTQRLEHDITNNILFISNTNLSGFYSTVNYQPIESNQAVAGFEFKREEEPTSGFMTGSSGQFTNSTANPAYQDLSLLVYSVFLQDTQNIFSKKTQLTVGLRYDALSLFHNQFNYRLGLTHTFENGVYAKVLYGTAYRAPSFVEFTRSFAGVQVPQSESVKTFEATLGYQCEKLNVNLTGYRNSYDDVIGRRQGSSIFSNVDHQIVTGVELESQLRFDEHWKSFLNASWSYAISTQKQQQLPLLADWTVATGLEWSTKVYDGELVFNNQVVVYGKRLDWQANYWKNGVELRLPNRSAALVDGFATWNSSLHYKLPLAATKHAVDFDLSAHNILNKSYYTQSLTPPSPTSAATFDTQYQGRQVHFSISYSW